MTEAERQPEAPFPDVRTQPRVALIWLIGLSIVYAVSFSLFAAPSRMSGAGLYASLGLGVSLLFLSYIDLRTGLLLDVITLPLIAAGIAFALLFDGAWGLSLTGAIVGYALIAGLGYIWRYTRGYEGIGLGDAKLLAAGGAWVGLTSLPMILLIASGTGLLIALIVSRKSQSTEERLAIPFGPALGVGIWIAWSADGIVLL